MRPFRRPLDSVVLACSIIGLFACSPSTSDSTDPQRGEAIESSSSPAAPDSRFKAASVETQGRITLNNILENERYWPNIAALTQAWTPQGAEKSLIKGFRGALIRVDEEGHARIAFGRHGTHDIPIEFTDLIYRANQVESRDLHKVAPNFLAHFGTQFLHPSTEEMLPFPTPDLAKSGRFLCIFANPREPGFKALARQLMEFEDQQELQTLFFPLATKVEDLEFVKKELQILRWPVPFAYPLAAETHARSLLGEVPRSAHALLVTDEGRLLKKANLDGAGAIDSIRAAVKSTPTDSTPDSPTPDTKAG